MALRLWLRKIRQDDTRPWTVLSNGKTASETAYEYIHSGNTRRNTRKKLRSESEDNVPNKRHKKCPPDECTSKSNAGTP
jgi:hypothetical protein